ncbi:NAD(P)-binding protein [Guyanagaster necrorhizus]|uniref:NAD(P)-binding protein n=1 Tax=Guyanagaster necrorhizus TaxID=856835 RepID=A0A9P7VR20_9AGAR|nr:NAD(P)-binding protein [Guyanagaster necrorhizus MCA 3950]KAG7444404.1 NAD(P)-binding protein [Guyanagaster necrorhizus MCA 3950]
MARKSFFAFLKDQRTAMPPVVKIDLSGKTIIVVGANTGLGFQATKHFATMNPERIILACRSEERGQAALERLRNETGYQKAELWLVDLSRFSSVTAFANKFEADGGRLDILVLNAGVIPDKTYRPTVDGWESSLQINDIASPLLALRLLPRMLHTAKEHNTTPRICVVASDVHYWANIPQNVTDGNILATLSSKEYCTPSNMQSERYNLTKLLNVFFTRSLQSRLPESIIVNAINPGFCESELRRSLTTTWYMAFADWAMVKLIGYTTEEGSRQLVWAAVGGGEEENSLRGGYVSFSKIVEVSDFAISERGLKAQEKIWDELVDILSKVDERIPNVIESCLGSA